MASGVAGQTSYTATHVAAPGLFGEPAVGAGSPPHSISKPAGHYSKTDWQRAIDATWGSGLSVSDKLAIFDLFWNTIDDSFACFNNLIVNWDSLRALYRPEIEGGVSRGRFASIMNHLAMALCEAHTFVKDNNVSYASLLPGVPVWVVGAWMDVGHFGAALTPLADSSLLVYRVVDNHPLGLQRGDVVLGYDHRRWVDILRELGNAQLPIRQLYTWGSCSTAMTYSLMNAAGMNWHLFDTIDIAKYPSGDTLHLPTSLLVGQSMHLFATDQLDIPGVPMPDPDGRPSVSFGVMSGTRVGYIYVWRWVDNAAEFHDAVSALTSDKTIEGTIIDFRFNQGGGIPPSDSGLNLLFRDSTETICFTRRHDAGDHGAMRVIGPASDYVIPGNGIGYDKPIAVLVGPGAVSAGDQVAYRMTFHPNAKTFGKSTNAAFSSLTALTMPTGWSAQIAGAEACLASDTTHFLTHREFPVDVPVWHTRDAVARGEDAVVEAAEAWISSGGSYVTSSAMVARSVLRLPEHANSRAICLLDVGGRKVMDLQHGANDVSRLSAGIYFLREGPQGSSYGPQTVTIRKVVIVR
jgi:hypothetical protein